MSTAAAGVNVTGPGVAERRASGSKVEQVSLLASDATCVEPPPRTTPAQQAAMLVEAVPVRARLR